MKLAARLVVLALALSAHSAHAQAVIGPTTILQVANGWGGEQLALTIAGGSSTCPGGPNEYTIRKDHPAYKDMVALALTAFAAGTSVIIRPEGTCLDNNRALILELRLVK